MKWYWIVLIIIVIILIIAKVISVRRNAINKRAGEIFDQCYKVEKKPFMECAELANKELSKK